MIEAALSELKNAATSENKAEGVQFANELAAHAAMSPVSRMHTTAGLLSSNAFRRRLGRAPLGEDRK
jgi:hypothetical protein